MPDNPICPNCGRSMGVARTLADQDNEPATHVFECKVCHVSFITEDHEPIAGRVVH
jgi:transcription elongation factor Elf1